MKEMQKIRERLAAFKPRSAWDKGVKEITKGLLDKYEEIVRYREGSDPVPPLTEKTVLNGAGSWEQYCYGGCAMICDREIAETLCTPSELRRTDFGRKARRATANRHAGSNTQARHNNVKHVAY